MMPTIHVTNWSSRTLHGAGRRLTIMAAPRSWERGDGLAPVLIPPRNWVRHYLAGGRSELGTYCRAYVARVQEIASRECLRPGGPVGLEDGDTLCCACSREAAAAGACHRVWAAELLRQVGWRVLLDGRELVGVEVGEYGQWVPITEAT